MPVTLVRTDGCAQSVQPTPKALKESARSERNHGPIASTAGTTLKAKGGSYRSIAHMRSQMTLEGVRLPRKVTSDGEEIDRRTSFYADERPV